MYKKGKGAHWSCICARPRCFVLRHWSKFIQFWVLFRLFAGKKLQIKSTSETVTEKQTARQSKPLLRHVLRPHGIIVHCSYCQWRNYFFFFLFLCDFWTLVQNAKKDALWSWNANIKTFASDISTPCTCTLNMLMCHQVNSICLASNVCRTEKHKVKHKGPRNKSNITSGCLSTDFFKYKESSKGH